jgi:plastocyanin
MQRQLLSFALMALSVAALAGCGDGASGTASAPAAGASNSDSSVTISDFKFTPRTVTVKQGAPIRITNRGGMAHTLTADKGHSFDSGTVAAGGSATIRVAQTGRFSYHCSIHPFMKGQLVSE